MRRAPSTGRFRLKPAGPGDNSSTSRQAAKLSMGKRLPLFFILCTVAIDAIGIGIIVPVMPDLLLEVAGGTLGEAAVWGGILATVFALMQFVCGPTVGSLSDRFGRRPVLLIALLFMSLDYILMGFANALWILFVGRVIGGITASTPATATAFISDISKPSEKAKNFGLIGAAFGVGFVLGPLFGAFFAEFGTRAPFFAAAAFSFANMLLGYFVLPETVTDKIRRPFEWKRANPLGAFYQIGKLPELKTILIVLLIFQIAFAVYPAIWPFFATEAFGWEPRMIGVSLAAYGIAIALVQGFGIRWVLRYLTERQAVILGLVFEVVGFLGYGFATATWQAFVLIAISSLGGITLPSLQSIAARRAFDNQQGELQGVWASVTSLGFMIAPIIMTQAFYYFTGPEAPAHLPGSPFLLAMILSLAAMALFLFYTREENPK